MPVKFRPVMRGGAAVLALVLVGWFVSSVHAFTNGQPASLVLGQPDFTSLVDTANERVMSGPTGVAIDPTSGTLFVADSLNNRVLRFANLAALANGAPAEAVLGQPDFTTTTRATSQNGMDSPYGVAVDNAGHLWVADSGNVRVLRFDNAATLANGAPANAVLGQPDFTTAIGRTRQDVIASAYGVAVDNAGRLWVSDGANSRVLRFDNAAALPNGAPASGVLGQPDFTSLNSGTSQSGMSGPHGLTVDGAGRLWVADTLNSRVLRFDNAATLANGAPAAGVLGQSSFTTSTQAAGQSGLGNPEGLTVDGAGRLWVADTLNSRVLRFDDAATKANGVGADGVLGQPDFSTSGISRTQSGLHFLSGVAVNDVGSVWVADTGNSRVLRFDSIQQVYLPLVTQ